MRIRSEMRSKVVIAIVLFGLLVFGGALVVPSFF